MQPLEGIRVVDLSRALSGPLCTMGLGDLGAEVVKIEEPGVGDDTRHWGPPFQNGVSAYFLSCNRNKRGIALNLKREGGREALWRLIEGADVLVENFRPGVLEKLGFGYEAVRERNPRIVYCSISAYGQDGPEAAQPGYDIILQGTTGVASLTGVPEGDPVRCGLPVCDVLAGMAAQQAVLAALFARERTGRGQRVETTMLEATVAAMGNFAASYLMADRLPPRAGNSHPQIAPYDLIRTADGHVYVAGANEGVWLRFCAALGLDALTRDPRFTTNAERVAHRADLLAAIESVTTRIPTAGALAKLDAARVPAGPIRDLRQVFESPQAAHLGLAQSIEHPAIGAFQVVSSPLHLSETPVSLRYPPPLLGEHTDAVLRDLGFAEEEIAAMRAQGAV